MSGASFMHAHLLCRLRPSSSVVRTADPGFVMLLFLRRFRHFRRDDDNGKSVVVHRKSSSSPSSYTSQQQRGLFDLKGEDFGDLLRRSLVVFGLVVEEDAEDGDGHPGSVGQRHRIAE